MENEAIKDIVEQLAADKKKTAIAVVLIAIMVVMWMRVIGKGGPESAKAYSSASGLQAVGKNNVSGQIEFIKLPEVEGRNDVLTKNVFEVKNWQSFMTGSNFGFNEIKESESSKDKDVQILSRNMRLEAIDIGDKPRAFINGQLLAEGDNFSLRVGERLFECYVKQVQDNLVIVEYDGIDISLRLSQSN